MLIGKICALTLNDKKNKVAKKNQNTKNKKSRALFFKNL